MTGLNCLCISLGWELEAGSSLPEQLALPWPQDGTAQGTS